MFWFNAVESNQVLILPSIANEREVGFWVVLLVSNIDADVARLTFDVDSSISSLKWVNMFAVLPEELHRIYRKEEIANDDDKDDDDDDDNKMKRIRMWW